MKIFQKSPKRLFLSICLILRTTNYMPKKLKWLKIDFRRSLFCIILVCSTAIATIKEFIRS